MAFPAVARADTSGARHRYRTATNDPQSRHPPARRRPENGSWSQIEGYRLFRPCPGARHRYGSATNAPQLGGLRTRGDHHAARGVLEDVVGGGTEDLAALGARCAEHDDLALPPQGLVDDRAARA